MRVVLFVLVAILSGCIRPVVPSGPLPSAEQLLGAVTAQAQMFSSLDGEARVGVTANGRYVPTQQFLSVEKPDRFRADVLSTFGQLLVQLAVEQDMMAVHLHTTVPGRFYRDRATGENLARFIRLPIDTDQLVRLLLVDPPLIDSPQRRVQREGTGYRLTIENPPQRQDILFDQELRLSEVVYWYSAEPVLRVAYDDYSEKQQFPHRIDVEAGPQKTRMTARFSVLQLNGDIADSRFLLDPPAGMAVETFVD
ncbi:MAG: hypothetical protein C0618_00265 [Desulfuromonas sp.]|nr:MAG: hypothetical protein C0618_00265 [Desulfuromonas sp.]